MNRQQLLYYTKFGLLAAFGFSIAACWFIAKADYTNTWALFAGSFLFLILVSFFLFRYNKLRGAISSTGTMIKAGLIVTIIGVALSVIISFLLLLLMDHGIFQTGVPEKVLSSGPAAMSKGKTDGLAFILWMTATMGNISAGVFASVIIPFSIKKQTARSKNLPDN